MTTKTSTYYEVSVKYRKRLDSGVEKPVTETYLVEAISFTDAEATAIQRIRPGRENDFIIKNINPAPYKTLYYSDLSEEEKWYKIKVEYITMNDNGEEKRSKDLMLLQAPDMPAAHDLFYDIMRGTTLDYEEMNIQVTKILEAFLR